MNKIYENESYNRRIETVVTSLEETDNGVFITLEDSIFFPEEGGQYADTGIIIYGDEEITLSNGILIQSEADGKETIIKYAVSKPAPAGAKVICVLDWDKRYSRMQNHSGEHIISGLIYREFGYNNAGFHLSDDGPVTLDVDHKLTPEQVDIIEKMANEVIYRNLPITASYPSKEELVDISYRSKIDILGQVRLITVGDENETIDVCACCAPHVARTGEIGIIKVISHCNYKGGTQISILCGRRALEYLSHIQSSLNDIAGLFSTHPDNVKSLVVSLKDELSDCKAELSSLIEAKYLDIIRTMSDSESHIIFTDDNLLPANMKNIFNALTAQFDDYVGIFVGNDTDGYRFYAGSRTLDTAKLGATLREQLGAKGGGKGEMIQGQIIAAKDDILDVIKCQ